MRTWKLLLAGSLLCVQAGIAQGQEPTAATPARIDTTALISDATEVALEWLATVDSGTYAESWADAAAFFKEAVTEETWIGQLNKVRKPLGDIAARALVESQYTTLLPTAPEGEYVILRFKSSFEAYPDATETVTPMKDPDGVWRVAGYFIK